MTLKPEEGQDAEQAMKYTNAKKLPQYIAGLSVCLGSVAAGTVLGWTANISIGDGEFNNIMGIGSDEMGWIGSLATLGAMVMCFPIGIICDGIGRKTSMLLLVIPFLVGWFIILFAENLAMIYVGRFITGMAGGAFCVSAPMYTSEIAQKEIRGTLGSFFQLLLTVGIFFAYVIAYVTTPKTFTIICTVVPLVFGVVFFFQPETPVYLLKKNKDADARKSLIRLRGSEYDVDTEMKEIKMMLEEQNQIKMPFKQAIQKRAAKKAAIIAFGLMLFQQLSGVNAIIFYAGVIFKSANTGLGEKEATMIFGGMQVMATFVSSLVVDRLGRKILLIGSDSLMAVSSILLGIYFSIKNDVESIGFLPIFALCLFIVVFSLGYGPIPWMISSEVFPPEIKTVASSAAGTFNWLMAFVVTKVYFIMVDAFNEDVTFYVFGGISVLGTLFVIFCVPETKGKYLDQIQRELSGETTSSSQGIDNHAYSN